MGSVSGVDNGVLGRSALLGAATGLRSTIALGALSVRHSPGLGPVLVHRAAPALGALAVGAELVLDKLPMTGSRLEPVGIVFRVLFAGTAAAALARAHDESPVLPIAVAATAAVAAAKIGHDLRAAAADRLPDPVIAVVEDAVAIALATAATA